MAGTVTGARIFQILASRKMRWAPAARLAEVLAKEPGYVRRTCNQLTHAGLLERKTVAQVGTRAVFLYKAKSWDGVAQPYPDVEDPTKT